MSIIFVVIVGIDNKNAVKIDRTFQAINKHCLPSVDNSNKSDVFTVFNLLKYSRREIPKYSQIIIFSHLLI